MATQLGGLNHQQADGYQSAFGGTITPPRVAKAIAYEHKADKFSLLGVAFIAGWISCSVYNDVAKLWSDHGKLQVIETKTVPQLQAKIVQQGCTIDKVATVAADAIAANKAAGVEGPDFSDIQPCPPVKPVVPQAAKK